MREAARDGRIARGPRGSMTWPLGLLVLAALATWLVEARRRTRHPVPPGYQRDISLPHTQAFELYHNALSLCSMKTRVCLAELGIPYRSHPIDLIETGAYENIRAPFLRVNPGGTVPVLVHQGHPIYESHEQIRYAARHAPAGSPSLIPDDPGLRAELERWIDRASLTGDPMNEGEQSAGNTVPGLTLPLFAAMIDRIAVWKHLFARRRELAGDLPAPGPGRLAPRVLGAGRRPACDAWWRRLTARPAYREAILGHAHPTIAYGTERLRRLKQADPALREAIEGTAV
jgi:glutathione S-transferase